jgi:nucleoside-diphosphate-sugar epimerase
MKAVIASCEKYKAKLVFFDNVYMYEPASVGHMTEELPYKPATKKGKVRAEVAQILLNAVAEGKVTALIGRAADFYGPHNERSILGETVYKNLKKGKAANWMGRTDKKHTFTFTPDAARATALLGNTADAYNQTWHLPTDKNGKTGKEFVEVFAKGLSQKPKLMRLPTWLIGVIGWFVPFMREIHEMMYQYDQDYFFDSTKFEKRFGIQPTPYEEGVRQTIAAG